MTGDSAFGALVNSDIYRDLSTYPVDGAEARGLGISLFSAEGGLTGAPLYWLIRWSVETAHLLCSPQPAFPLANPVFRPDDLAIVCLYMTE